jgi:benzoylsuccinyl-CoA thiolase BbsB subunit
MRKIPLRRVAVIGVGMSKFGKQSEKGLVELGTEACLAAIKDCGIVPRDIDGVYSANAFGDTGCLGQQIAMQVGIVSREMARVENACAGGTTAVREVFYAIGTGRWDIGLAVGVDSMTTCMPKGPITAKDIDGDLGLSMPAYGAMQMQRYMHKYGATVEQFAQVSVKNHINGSLNPFAMYQKVFTLEEVLNSRMVAEPLTQYMVSPVSDGAAAAILCAEDKVNQYTTKPVWLVGSSLISGDYTLFAKDMDISTMGEQASAEAYEMAGIGPEDIDVVELHDAFAANEIPNIEDLGICRRGEGARLLQEGHFDLNGKVPVNPSGGLLSQGHPLSASGVRQIAELTWHLRDQAGQRQVKGAKVGLAHMEGGVVSGLQGGACGINIVMR